MSPKPTLLSADELTEALGALPDSWSRSSHDSNPT